MNPSLLSDPLHVAWEYLQDISENDSTSRRGICARCKQTGYLTPLSAVISHNFTGWEGINPAADGMCQPCAWGFNQTILRTQPLYIDDQLARFASLHELSDLLTAPLPSNIALTVPIAGKKHLLPYAHWGRITSDAGTHVWGPHEATLMRDIIKLRLSGVTSVALAQTAPPIKLLIEQPGIHTTWAQLNQWRRTPFLSIAIKISNGYRK